MRSAYRSGELFYTDRLLNDRCRQIKEDQQLTDVFSDLLTCLTNWNGVISEDAVSTSSVLYRVRIIIVWSCWGRKQCRIPCRKPRGMAFLRLRGRDRVQVKYILSWNVLLNYIPEKQRRHRRALTLRISRLDPCSCCHTFSFAFLWAQHFTMWRTHCFHSVDGIRSTRPLISGWSRCLTTQLSL